MESIRKIFTTPLRQNDLALWPGAPVVEKCSECGDPVTMQIMKNTGICSEICRKHRDGEISTLEWSKKKVGF